MTEHEIQLANEHGVVPQLIALDLGPVTAFWTRLGFTIMPVVDDLAFARSVAMLTYAPAPRMDVRITNCVAFIKTDRVDDLHGELAASGIWQVHSPATNDRDVGFDARLEADAGIERLGRPADREWGMREFRLFDPSNNLVRFAQDL